MASLYDPGSSFLDTWVFHHFFSLLEKAKSNNALLQALNRDKVVFFIHLQSSDIKGHTYFPTSREYLLNIKDIDKGIEKVVDEVEKFYENDKQTAYVFTSDHGMTDWGTHVSGLLSETSTPLVVWGSGAMKHYRNPTTISIEKQQRTKLWGLDHSWRRDVNQVDIAPLMAALLGVPIPVNSVGVLPHDFISLNAKSKAKLMLTNMKQISEQFLIKHDLIKRKSFVFNPFSKLSPSQIVDAKRKLSEMIREEKYEVALTESRRVIDLSLEGLQYYHTYHRLPLYIAVVLGFVGWIFFNVVLMLDQVHFISNQAKKITPLSSNQSDQLISLTFFVLEAVTVAMLFLLDLSLSYYFYFSMPLLIWHRITKYRFVVYVSISTLRSNLSLAKRLASHCLLGMVGVWLLVVSFFHRYVLTFELIIFGLLVLRSNASRQTKLSLSCLCLLMSVFPLLPVVGREPNILLVVLAAVLATFFSYSVKSSKESCYSFLVVILPLLSGCLSSAVTISSSWYNHVNFLFHVGSWCILLSSWIIPFFSSTQLHSRISCIFTCHCASYILFSLSHDALFCVFFCVLLAVWIRFEIETSRDGSVDAGMNFPILPISFDLHHQTSFDILRVSYLAVFFVVFAFFGVGNIASINSFEVKNVLPFITVMREDIVGGLLAYKVLLPNLLVACSLYCVAVATKCNLNQLLQLSSIISDVMALHFFFMVKDSGTTDDISESISHYVINSSMMMSLLLFFGVAKYLTTWKILSGISKKGK